LVLWVHIQLKEVKRWTLGNAAGSMSLDVLVKNRDDRSRSMRAFAELYDSISLRAGQIFPDNPTGDGIVTVGDISERVPKRRVEHMRPDRRD
tara:strand:- start:800 stop:1075 length:276 start_codon:yes stop_codon:yes gene_type:complete